MAVTQETTLYDRVGGASALQVVVGAFYDRVLVDDNLNAYFRTTDMGKQQKSMLAFLSMALGGPNDYDGRPMKEAHEHLGITDLHFDLVADHLVAALEGAGMPSELVNEIITMVAPLKPVVVTS